MKVTHNPDHPTIGSTHEPWWWGLDGEGQLIDFGDVYRDDPNDFWVWHLIQYNGTYYLGLPGLDNFRSITSDQCHDREQLDGEIGDLLISHGI
jgi:hypothetical protein